METQTSFIALIVVLIFYFIPAGLAHSRKHRNAAAIGLLNLFFGWTIIGWIAALIWANTGNTREGEPTPATHVTCPDCTGLVPKAARACMHCGCRLKPQ